MPDVSSTDQYANLTQIFYKSYAKTVGKVCNVNPTKLSENV